MCMFKTRSKQPSVVCRDLVNDIPITFSNGISVMTQYPCMDVVHCVNSMYLMHSVHDSYTWINGILLIFNLVKSYYWRMATIWPIG